MHVVAPAGVGGLERVVQMLAASQHGVEDDVQVVGVFPEDPPMRPAAPGVSAAPIPESAPDHFFSSLRAAGVPTHTVRVPARGYGKERAAVTALCRTHRPDVVHLHGYRPDVVDASAARAAGAAVVTTVHGFTGGDLRNRCYEWLQRRSIRRFDAVVAVSRPLAGRLLQDGIPAHRMHLVVNAWQGGAPLDRAAARHTLGVPDRIFAIGWVGRLSREKGLDVLLRALPALGSLPYALHVIGEGRERPALEALARQLGVAERVIWHGAISNAERLFTGFDTFVLSSRTEGTPLVLFEAMGAEVPIVTTHVGGIPDIVSDREAVLVPAEDPEALAAAVRTIYALPKAAARRVRAARIRLCAEHRIRNWVERYHLVYAAARAATGGQA